MFFIPYGAAREVTGSMHLISTGEDNIILDCGLFQGRRKEAEVKNRNIPIDPEVITSIVLSHAHIDHCGRIPLFVKSGFRGRILSTRPTVDAADYLLRDSAHLNEMDAQYINYKTARKFLIKKIENDKKKNPTQKEIKKIKRKLKKDKHKIDVEAVNEVIKKYDLNYIIPLYNSEDVETALKQFEGYPYQKEITVGKNMTCTFFEAGHILGSAISLIKLKNRQKTYRVLFTGDLGRFNKPILKDPQTCFPNNDRLIDLLILESTYGDRVHEPMGNLKERLRKIIVETNKRGGSVIIPAFAFGRTQEVIYFIHELFNEKKIPEIPVYVDSPLANRLTTVFGEHPETYDKMTHKSFLEKGQNPFIFEKLTYVSSVEESMKVMKDQSSKIVISASGMCEGGRILHHLRYHIHNSKNTILIVGYMAEHTLGRQIRDLGIESQNVNSKNPPTVKIFNKKYPVKARVEEIGGFSAHADQEEIMRFLKESELKIKKIALVHGEKRQIKAFSSFLNKKGYQAIVPFQGQIIRI